MEKAIIGLAIWINVLLGSPSARAGSTGSLRRRLTLKRALVTVLWALGAIVGAAVLSWATLYHLS